MLLVLIARLNAITLLVSLSLNYGKSSRPIDSDLDQNPEHVPSLTDQASMFSEVLSHTVKNTLWKVVYSARWRYQEDILRTEGRALVWNFRRLVRSQKFLNARLLFLVDNLPLVFACGKGRSSSVELIPICC